MSSNEIIEKIDKLLENGEGAAFPSKKLEHIKWVIEQSDQELIPGKLVKVALQNLANAKRYVSNPAQIEVYIDNILPQFPVPWNKKRPKAETQKIIDELRDNTNSVIAASTQKIGSLEEELERKNDELTTLTAALDAVRIKIDAESKRLDVMVTNEQSALADKKAKIDEGNSAFIEKTKKEITDKADSEVQAFRVVLDSDVASLKADISTLKEEAKSDHERIRILLGIASDDTMTKDYSDLSEEEKTPTTNWSHLAVICFLCVPIAAILMAVRFGMPYEISFNAMLVRFSLPFSFLILAIYAARKSSHHRDTHLRAKRTHIRYSTLEPYLEKFSPEKRDEIRESLIDEFFKEKVTEKIKSPIIGLSFKQVSDLIAQIRATLNQ